MRREVKTGEGQSPATGQTNRKSRKSHEPEEWWRWEELSKLRAQQACAGDICISDSEGGGGVDDGKTQCTCTGVR